MLLHLSHAGVDCLQAPESWRCRDTGLAPISLCARASAQSHDSMRMRATVCFLLASHRSLRLAVLSSGGQHSVVTNKRFWRPMMRSKLSLLLALAMVLLVTEMAVAIGLSKSSAPAPLAATITCCCPDGSCCPDGPCCRQMADSKKAGLAQCDCPFCSGLAIAAKISCCPEWRLLPGQCLLPRESAGPSHKGGKKVNMTGC
jgi:hypothetical protein